MQTLCLGSRSKLVSDLYCILYLERCTTNSTPSDRKHHLANFELPYLAMNKHSLLDFKVQPTHGSLGTPQWRAHLLTFEGHRMRYGFGQEKSSQEWDRCASEISEEREMHLAK